MSMFTNPSQMLMLFNWMAPNSPAGGMAGPYGLEQAFNAGKLRSPADIEGWIKGMLEAGAAWNDAVLFARCWQDNTAKLNEMAQALAGSAGRYQQSVELGRNFWDAARIWFDNLMPTGNMAYPVAAGTACAAAGLVAQEALLGFLQNIAATQVAEAMRLGSLSQNTGLEIMKNLAPVIERVAERASKATLKDIG